MTTPDVPEYLTTEEAAKLRRKSAAHLRFERMNDTGPPYIRDGGRVLYRRSALLEWLADREIDPAQIATS